MANIQLLLRILIKRGAYLRLHLFFIVESPLFYLLVGEVSDVGVASCVFTCLAGMKFVKGCGEAFFHHLPLRTGIALFNFCSKRKHGFDKVPHRAVPPVVGYRYCCHYNLFLDFPPFVTPTIHFYCADLKQKSM